MVRITRLVLKSGMRTEVYKELPHALEFKDTEQASATIRELYRGLFPAYLGMMVAGHYTGKNGEERSVWVKEHGNDALRAASGGGRLSIVVAAVATAWAHQRTIQKYRHSLMILRDALRAYEAEKDSHTL